MRPAEPTPSAAATSRPSPPSGPAVAPARIDSARLFAGAAEVHIDHDGVIYRLKRTALGKLILTK